MKKINFEFNNYNHLEYKAKNNEKYYLNIFDDSGLNIINLENFNKSIITFGKNFSNDIVIDSSSVDFSQGYLELTEYGILIANSSDNIEMLGKNNKSFKNFYLTEGSFAKFPPLDPNSNGVIIVMSIGNFSDNWEQLSIDNRKISIGSSNTCDITLPQNGIAKTHAILNFNKNKALITDNQSLNGILVNGIEIPTSQNIQLDNLDIFIIGNTKFVLFNKKIYYQILERGIRLDAIDICKKVRVKFKTKQISTNINMTIKPSEFIAFVGGSGAGKSTFLKCISGVNKPSSGKVLLNGEDLYENYSTLKYNIGYVPQEDIVYSNLTLFDMLNYAAKLRMPENTPKKTRIERIKEVLDIVQLENLENVYIRQLSGGQRKRASIAVELLADPSLFFLDEPTSGLDPGTERSVMKTLRKMSDMGKTIILVTHNTLNLHLCDKVAFFGTNGRLCFYGPPMDALTFFGVNDFVDIYTLLNENTDIWHEKYKKIEQKPNINIEKIKNNNKTETKKKSFLKQLVILIKRYIKLISNDFQQLLLLFLQAPIIAYLLTLNSSSDLYKNYEDAKGIFFSMGCACIWLGLLNSIQEICKEKVILQKEYMADLKISAYIFSKFIVQLFLAFLQATLIVSIFQAISGSSEYSLLINSYWDIQIICFLTILSASALGLFISSFVKNSNIAMSIAPLVLVPQLLFSGILFKLEGFTDFISNFILCRWSVEGLGSSLNLNNLTHQLQLYIPNIEIEAEKYFTYTSNHMWQVVSIIILMTFVLLLASFFSLKRNLKKDIN